MIILILVNYIDNLEFIKALFRKLIITISTLIIRVLTSFVKMVIKQPQSNIKVMTK